MTLQEFNKLYNPEYKCYAVYTDNSLPMKDRCIERGLILDFPSPSSMQTNNPVININNFHTTIHLSDITDIIITKAKWSVPHA